MMNHKGVTLIETLASIIILSFVFTTIVTIIVNVRIQTIKTEERIIAVEVAKSIREDVENNVTYLEIIDDISSGNYTITQTECALITNGCSLFEYRVGEHIFDSNVSIVFLQSTAESLSYQVIHFEVIIAYHRDSELTVEGIIYES